MPHLMNCPHMADGWCLDCVVAQHGEIERLRDGNTKLIGAIDLIRETLNGGTVDDLAYIINRALEAAKA